MSTQKRRIVGWTGLIGLLMVAGCSFVPPAADRNADVIVVGDSILAWHRGSGRSIPDVVEQGTGLDVTNVSVSGARFLGAGNIPSQYGAGDWDWVIVNGGGNDLRPACGTSNATAILDALISEDGRSGAIPVFVDRAATGGAQVIILGYYPVSTRGGPFVRCIAVLDELAARQARKAATNPAVIFVDSGQAIGASDSASYAPDLVHPSPPGAALVGELVASTILQNTR